MAQKSPPYRERHLPTLASGRNLMLSALAVVILLWLFTPPAVTGLVASASKYSVALAAILPRLPDAIDHTREECERTAAERDAFQQFAQRVNTIEPEDPRPAPTSRPHEVSATGADSTSVGETSSQVQPPPRSEQTPLETIKEAYRETIMAVPHYEEEYGESLTENLAAELGPDIAQAVTEGDVFTRQLRTILVQKSLHAHEERVDFLRPLEDECEALIKARRRLRGMHDTVTSIDESLYPRPVREIVQSWERLDALETDCEAFLAERQSQLHTKSGGFSPRSLQLYLYQSYPWTYPVLNDGLDTLIRIRNVKQRALQEIYNW